MSAHQRKILLNTRARDVAILSLLLGTGIRVSECVGLNVTDVDFDTNAFTVTRKGGSRAILYFNDDVKEALRYYVDGERKALLSRTEKLSVPDPDALFLSLQVKRICVRAVENLVKKYAAVASPLKRYPRTNCAAPTAPISTAQRATFIWLRTCSDTAT